MATRTRGGTNQFLRRRVVKIFTNGKRADGAYGLSQHVDRIVKRADSARRRAVSATSRKAGPIAKSLITESFNIGSSHVTNRVKLYDTGDTMHVNASTYRFPLALFGARWGGPETLGATASIRRGESKTYQGAFMATGRYHNKVLDLVYIRARGGGGKTIKKVMTHGKYVGKRREVIHALRGPSTYNMLQEIQGKTATGRSGAGAYSRQLRGIYVSELRRLYELEARKDG